MLPAVVSIRNPACPTLVTCTNTLSAAMTTSRPILAGTRRRRRSTAAGSSRCVPGRGRHRSASKQLVGADRRRSSTTATASRPPGRPTGRRRRGRRDRRGRCSGPSSSISVLGAHASPWQTTSAIDGRRVASTQRRADRTGSRRPASRSCSSAQARRRSRARGVARPGHPVRIDSRAAGQPGGVQPARRRRRAPAGTATKPARPSQPVGLGRPGVVPTRGRP